MNIKEIARLADVSVATVSRCINTPEKVAVKTREKIESLIREHGYMPNPSAQSLSTGNTHTIGVVIANLKNEYFLQLVEGCEKAISAAGYRLQIYASQFDPEFWKTFDQRAVDGLVISGFAIPDPVDESLSFLKIPFVVIDHTDLLNDAMDISNVYIEDDAGVETALQYLYDEGNRHFGILCGNKTDETQCALRRLHAVMDFFDHHKDATYDLEYANYVDLSENQEACHRLLQKEKRPEAIFAFSDMIAAGALSGILESGLKIPDEIELIGFDNIPLSKYFYPSLTTIDSGNVKTGFTAAEILLKKLSGPTQPEHILFPVELKLRGTTKNIVKKAQ